MSGSDSYSGGAPKAWSDGIGSLSCLAVQWSFAFFKSLRGILQFGQETCGRAKSAPSEDEASTRMLPVSAEQGRGLIEREGWGGGGPGRTLKAACRDLRFDLPPAFLSAPAFCLSMASFRKASSPARKRYRPREREHGKLNQLIVESGGSGGENEAAGQGLTAPGSSAVLEPCRAQSPGACWYK